MSQIEYWKSIGFKKVEKSHLKEGGILELYSNEKEELVYDKKHDKVIDRYFIEPKPVEVPKKDMKDVVDGWT